MKDYEPAIIVVIISIVAVLGAGANLSYSLGFNHGKEVGGPEAICVHYQGVYSYTPDNELVCTFKDGRVKIPEVGRAEGTLK